MAACSLILAWVSIHSPGGRAMMRGMARADICVRGIRLRRGSAQFTVPRDRGVACASTCRAGVVLLEVIVALTILAVAGVSLAVLATQSASAVRRARTANLETQQASGFLDAVALWPRADLDRHLGERPEGPWRLTIERPLPTLYTVTLADS